MYPRYICEQLLIHLLHMFMMFYVSVNDCHLPPSDSRTDITHPIVISYFLMLIIRITLPILRRIHHNLAPTLLIRCNQCPTPRGGNHLITIEAQHAIFPKRPQHLSFIPASESFRCILNHGYSIPISNLHNPFYLIRHPIQCHRHNRLRIATRLSLSVFNRHLEQFRVHIPRLFLRVHEHRRSPQIRYRMT